MYIPWGETNIVKYVPGGEGGDRGWDGWMASVTQWTGIWVNSGSWWWTGKPDVLQSMGSQRVGHNWATELNWLRRNRDPAPGCIMISQLLFLNLCIPSLPWLATFWTWPLELKKGQGGWMKPISYKQETGDTERFWIQDPQRVLLGFIINEDSVISVMTPISQCVCIL